jgi:hypothetical protein
MSFHPSLLSYNSRALSSINWRDSQNGRSLRNIPRWEYFCRQPRDKTNKCFRNTHRVRKLKFPILSLTSKARGGIQKSGFTGKLADDFFAVMLKLGWVTAGKSCVPLTSAYRPMTSIEMISYFVIHQIIFKTISTSKDAKQIRGYFSRSMSIPVVNVCAIQKHAFHYFIFFFILNKIFIQVSNKSGEVIIVLPSEKGNRAIWRDQLAKPLSSYAHEIGRKTYRKHYNSRRITNSCNA